MFEPVVFKLEIVDKLAPPSKPNSRKGEFSLSPKTMEIKT